VFVGLGKGAFVDVAVGIAVYVCVGFSVGLGSAF
jgi:hypothetical protein